MAAHSGLTTQPTLEIAHPVPVEKIQPMGVAFSGVVPQQGVPAGNCTRF